MTVWTKRCEDADQEQLNPFVGLAEVLFGAIIAVLLSLWAVWSMLPIDVVPIDARDELGTVERIVSDKELRFASGKAEPESDEGLAEIVSLVGEMVEKGYTRIRVEGHTDNVPISSVRFPSNWELSAARAIWMARRLEESLGPARAKSVVIEAIGYGDRVPIATNASFEGRRRNRRLSLKFER